MGAVGEARAARVLRWNALSERVFSIRSGSAGGLALPSSQRARRSRSTSIRVRSSERGELNSKGTGCEGVKGVLGVFILNPVF
jgi:hypothetical protein